MSVKTPIESQLLRLRHLETTTQKVQHRVCIYNKVVLFDEAGKQA